MIGNTRKMSFISAKLLLLLCEVNVVVLLMYKCCCHISTCHQSPGNLMTMSWLTLGTVTSLALAISGQHQANDQDFRPMFPGFNLPDFNQR